jgi:hypothetical protein
MSCIEISTMDDDISMIDPRGDYTLHTTSDSNRDGCQCIDPRMSTRFFGITPA